MEAQAPRVAGVDLSTSSADEKRLHIDTEGKVVPVDDAAFLLPLFHAPHSSFFSPQRIQATIHVWPAPTHWRTEYRSPVAKSSFDLLLNVEQRVVSKR